ncbi:MAG: response regulator [Proteobacteria bacterium]|nr:response regulator [Pseudomonadota bacterium]
MSIMHLSAALSVGLLFLALTTDLAGNALAQEKKEDCVALSERQALERQDRADVPFGPEVPPVAFAVPQLSTTGNSSKQGTLRSQTSTTQGESQQFAKTQSLGVSASGWYIAALLALGGMLISSLVASRIRIERDAARLANTLKTDFLAHVSHEIRTPMNAILGFSQILKDQLHDERHQQYISAITISGNTLLRLINDLLDLAKIEAGKFELQPTAIALKGIALEIQTIFIQIVEDKHLEFVVDLDPALPESLYLDEVRLRQILFNLLKNAVKFTDKGRISLSMHALSPPAAGVFDLEIVVADTGIGIPAEEQGTIFEPFTQRKSQDNSKYAGTGLGLSITKRLVEMIGGEISVRSEVGRGSTFTAVLRKIPVASPLGSDAARKSEGGGSAIRFDEDAVILIIDAIDSSRMVIREFLRSTKIATVETISVADGIDWCMAIKPDMILLDYTMSYLQDPTLVARFNRVKEELNIPVVAVTSSSAVGSDEFHTDFHFDGWLKKPLLLADVMETLARFLPHSNLFHPADCSSSFADLRSAFVMPEVRQVQQATRKLENRLSSLMRILVDNMMVQWKENQETFIVNEIKTFAQEIQRLSMEFGLDFLGLWAAEVLSQVRTFDMERLPDTFKLFPELVAMIEKADQPDKDSDA